jgi:predicted NBD/HSP70 family sugar kinase
VATVRRALPTGASVLGFGIGIAGAVGDDGTVIDLAPNLGGLDIVRLTSDLRAVASAPVTIDNDVNAAALGEAAHGHAAGVRDFAFIAIGTGIGMGAVSGGRLLRGSRNAAGEIGYAPIGADPYDPAHHERGSLEEIVSGPGIAAAYRERTGVDTSTRELFDRVAEDPIAAAVIDRAAEYLALAIATVRSVLDPALVVLGGGVGSRPEMLARVAPWLDRLGAADLSVRTSHLGHTATVRGAVELARTAPNPAAAPVAAPQRTTTTSSHRDGTP